MSCLSDEKKIKKFNRLEHTYPGFSIFYSTTVLPLLTFRATKTPYILAKTTLEAVLCVVC
jgi:hypothetical protein